MEIIRRCVSNFDYSNKIQLKLSLPRFLIVKFVLCIIWSYVNWVDTKSEAFGRNYTNDNSNLDNNDEIRWKFIHRCGDNFDHAAIVIMIKLNLKKVDNCQNSRSLDSYVTRSPIFTWVDKVALYFLKRGRNCGSFDHSQRMLRCNDVGNWTPARVSRSADALPDPVVATLSAGYTYPRRRRVDDGQSAAEGWPPQPFDEK